MANADIGGNGAVWIGLETTYGTAIDPSDGGTGVWCPIISETLKYTEAKYYSPQIRQSAIVSAVVPSFYHVEGDIVMEVDPNYLPYFLLASRHDVSKTAGPAPFDYSAVPSSIGSTYPGGSAKGLSIAIIRNSVGFLYSGCVVVNWEFMIDNGVLRLTAGILGLAEGDLAGAVTESWADPALLGADAHSVFVDDAGTSPAFSGDRDNTFNGFTLRANYNGSPQNRITPTRSATFISYGEIETTYETELDFISKDEYNKMKDNTLRAIKLESVSPGGPTNDWSTADYGVQLTVNNSGYDTYDVDLAGMGDLIMARVTGRSIGIAGGDPYEIVCKSNADLTV